MEKSPELGLRHHQTGLHSMTDFASSNCAHIVTKFRNHCNCEQTQKHSILNEYLTDYSTRDKTWDVHKGQCESVAAIYETEQQFLKYAARMSCCAGSLRFAWVIDQETGEAGLKLKEAEFCRVRNCPICQWRRSMMWQARFFKSLPAIEAEYPSACWLFLTLTVRNCAVEELGATLHEMNQAWRRLVMRKEFSPVLGWIRTTEVTRGKDGSAHPHFHALLIVPPSWFTGRLYVKQEHWTELWQKCSKLGYKPIVDIRSVKSKAPQGKEPQTINEKLKGAIAETFKYAVKPSDMVADAEWFLEMIKQIHKKRFIATGGALKNVLKLTEENDQDFVSVDEDSSSENTGKRIGFAWQAINKRYKREIQLDR